VNPDVLTARVTGDCFAAQGNLLLDIEFGVLIPNTIEILAAPVRSKTLA
jgi:hypothetical protein